MAKWAQALATIVLFGLAGAASAELQQRLDALVAQIEFRYRGDATTREDRLAAVESVLAEWNRIESLGGGDDNREALADWIAQSLRGAMPGGSGRLPEAPRFVEPAPAPIVAETIPPAAEPEAIPPAEPLSPPIESDAPSIAVPADMTGTDANPGAPEPVVPLAIEPMPEETAPEARAVVPAKTVKTPDAARQPPALERRVVEKPVARVAEDPVRPSRSRWSRTPAAAPLVWDDPFESDPAASPNPLRGANRRRTALRPVFREADEVNIDFSELEARVRGFNSELRRLQAELINRPADGVEALNLAAERLGLLREQARFLELYRGGLNATDRRRLPMSLSLDLARELIRRRADELLAATPAERAAERRALRDLTDRMAGRAAAAATLDR